MAGILTDLLKKAVSAVTGGSSRNSSSSNSSSRYSSGSSSSTSTAQPDRYKYYNPREKEVAQSLEGWDRKDLQEYIYNKQIWDRLNTTGKTSTEYNALKDASGNYSGQWNMVDKSYVEARNKALRDKYGLASDNINLNDLGRLGADLTYGDFLSYGLNSDDPRKRETAKNLAGSWYDSMLPDEEDYGSARRSSSGGGSSGGGGYSGGGYSGGYDAQSLARAQRQAMRDYMDNALSPENYNAIFSQIMEQLMPQYNAQKAEIGNYMNEQRRLADVDADRRGLYTSGVGAVMQNQIADQEAKTLSAALAALQQQATQLTGEQQERMLRRAAIDGDWTTADLNAALGFLNSDRNYELGKGQLDLGYLNSDRDYQLGLGQLGLGQLNSDRDYQLGLGNLGLNKDKLAEDKRQFDAKLGEEIRQFDNNAAYRDTAFAESVRQFEKEMGYKWSSLSASNKAQAFSQQLQLRELALKEGQWTDQQAYNQLQQDREKLTDSIKAYEYVSGLMQSGATPDQLYAAVQPYKGYDPSLYADLLKTIQNGGSTTDKTTDKKAGLFGQSNNYNLGSYTDKLQKR